VPPGAAAGHAHGRGKQARLVPQVDQARGSGPPGGGNVPGRQVSSLACDGGTVGAVSCATRELDSSSGHAPWQRAASVCTWTHACKCTVTRRRKRTVTMPPQMHGHTPHAAYQRSHHQVDVIGPQPGPPPSAAATAMLAAPSRRRPPQLPAACPGGATAAAPAVVGGVLRRLPVDGRHKGQQQQLGGGLQPGLRQQAGELEVLCGQRGVGWGWE